MTMNQRPAGMLLARVSESASAPYCLLEGVNADQHSCFFVIELGQHIQKVRTGFAGKTVAPSSLGTVIFSGFGHLTPAVLDYIKEHYGIQYASIH